MLYVNEKIRMWNPETGQLDGRDEYEEASLLKIVEEGQALDALKRSPGWVVLEELLKTTCSDLKEKLAYEQDLEKFRRLQEG